MLTKTLRFDNDVVVVLRNQVSWSSDGLRAEMPQLDPGLYKKVKKAFEAMGGKWSRKDNATVFAEDPRSQVDGLVTHGILTVARDGFFPTPEPVISRMTGLAYFHIDDPDELILEPECGDGAIIAYLRKWHYPAQRLFAIEQDAKRCQFVRESYPGVHVACGDFLRFRNTARRQFKLVYMNPPFEQGQDADHVMYAFAIMAMGGKLVSVMGEGIFYRDDRKADNFRKWFKIMGGYSEKLPEKSFHASGTDVATRLVVLEKVGA